MKKKNVILATLIIFGFFFICVGNASAAAEWYDANVVFCGQSFGDTVVILTHIDGTTFTDKWFLADAAQQKSMLAAALTALSGGLKIKIYVDLASAATPTVYSMYVLAN